MSVSSFFGGIEKALNTFGAWVEKEWTKLFNAAPPLLQLADTILSYTLPSLQIVLAALDPAAATMVGPIFAEIQKDLTVVSGLIHDFGATPNAVSILTTIENDLSNVLQAGHIKDAKLAARLTAIINGIGSLAIALANALAMAQPPATPAPTPTA